MDCDRARIEFCNVETDRYVDVELSDDGWVRATDAEVEVDRPTYHVRASLSRSRLLNDY